MVFYAFRGEFIRSSPTLAFFSLSPPPFSLAKETCIIQGMRQNKVPYFLSGHSPILLAALLFILLLFSPSCTGENSASHLVETFTAAMEQQDFSGAYACLWQRAEIVSEETFVSTCSTIVSTLGVSNITFSDASLKTEDGTVYFNYTIRFETTEGYTIENTVRLHVLKEEGAYHIEYLSGMLLPNYAPGDKITRITLTGKRGEIFTADGTLVASNDYSETIYINVNKKLDINAAIYSISALTEMTEEEQVSVRTKYNSALENNYATIVACVLPKGTLTSELRASLLAIEGVGIDTDSLTPQRYYPYANVYAHVTGYASAPTADELSTLFAAGYPDASLVGKAGIEKEYDSDLQPKNGFRINLYSKEGGYISTLYEQPAVDGSDIFLTIRSSAQQEAYYLMASYLSGDQTGASILMDPTTGFVEAMVSSPSYDPNIFSFAVDEDYLAELTSSESLNPLFNRATSGLYPPGSVIKPFSVTPALENGIVTRYTIFPYTINANKWTPEGVWYWDPVTRNEKPDSDLDLDTAIRFSDNIYFSWVALKTGDKLFMEYMERIGIGEAIPFDLPTATSNLINDGTEMNRKLLSDMSFGHGELLITPLQAASMYSAFQNSGDMLTPKLVWKICKMVDGVYTTTYEAQSEIYIKSALKKDTVDILNYSLKRVVVSGTAKSIQIAGKTLAAKTGTALKGEDKNRKIAWIAAWYQDMSEHRLAVVIVDSDRSADDHRHAITKALLNWEY